MTDPQATEEFDLVADVPIEEVRATRDGFVLHGRGVDRQGYRLELHIDWPVDAKTKAVLGEILSQTELKILRWRAPARKPTRP